MGERSRRYARLATALVDAGTVVSAHDHSDGVDAYVADRYREAGLESVSVRLYSGARHEVFNETNRDEVTADVVAWIDRLIGG